MADYMSWQETTITHVLGLDVPSNGGELRKMLASARQKFADAYGREPLDDEITVTTRDCSVILSFPVLSQKHHQLPVAVAEGEQA